jgi:hypothetical protein
VRAAPRRARERAQWPRTVVGATEPTVVILRGRIVGLLADRPPDGEHERHERELRRDGEPEESERHSLKS